MNIGEEQIKVADSPTLGPVLIQIGQEIISAMPPARAEKDRPQNIREQLDLALDVLRAIHDRMVETEVLVRLLTEIRDLSVPWYARLWRWLKEKF